MSKLTLISPCEALQGLLLPLVICALPTLVHAQGTNLSLDSRTLAASGEIVFFAVREASQGNTDLNGDEDTGDLVVHVAHGALATTTNLGLAQTPSNTYFVVEGRRAAFPVSEMAQGNTDLNGDGDALDQVLHMHDFGLGTTVNLARASAVPQISRELVAFPVSEADQGTDLNGDLDLDDFTIHVFRTSTGAVDNLGLAATGLALSGEIVLFTVGETEQGVTDLNGDGDTTDEVLHVHDSSSSMTTNLAISAEIPFGDLASNDRFALIVEEADEFLDLNGDGDTLDPVLHVYDRGAATIVNVGLAVPDPGAIALFDDRLFFPVSEEMSSHVDLNGDGDALDKTILHVHDLASGVTTTSASPFLCSGSGAITPTSPSTRQTRTAPTSTATETRTIASSTSTIFWPPRPRTSRSRRRRSVPATPPPSPSRCLKRDRDTSISTGTATPRTSFSTSRDREAASSTSAWPRDGTPWRRSGAASRSW